MKLNQPLAVKILHNINSSIYRLLGHIYYNIPFSFVFEILFIFLFIYTLTYIVVAWKAIQHIQKKKSSLLISSFHLRVHINVFLSKIIQLKRSQTRVDLILIIFLQFLFFFVFQLHFPQKKNEKSHKSLQISLN